jgi:hypothetical protein
VTIRKVEQQRELRKIGRPGVPGAAAAPPAGISPILRASWKFAHSMAERFSKELLNNRAQEFLKQLAKRFS